MNGFEFIFYLIGLVVVIKWFFFGVMDSPKAQGFHKKMDRICYRIEAFFKGGRR